MKHVNVSSANLYSHKKMKLNCMKTCKKWIKSILKHEHNKRQHKPTQANTNQHESTPVNLNQHESDTNHHEPK